MESLSQQEASFRIACLSDTKRALLAELGEIDTMLKELTETRSQAATNA